MHDFLNGRLRILQGDITKLQVDAIVNAANRSLMGGGGVDGAIHRIGGGAILEECKQIRKKRYPGGLPTGKAEITTAGNLPARYVIHTVGPVWYGGKKGEEELLRSAYTNSLSCAKEHNCKSIAFPAVSTGIYGYPKEKAALVAFSAVETFIRKNPLPEQISFVFFTNGDSDLFIRTIEYR